MTINELFHNLQERAGRLTLSPDLAAVIAFNITGSEPAQWHGRVEGGRAVLCDGQTDSADITVSAASEVAIGLFEKKINPMAAFMTGKIKVRGDKSKIGLIKTLLMGRAAGQSPDPTGQSPDPTGQGPDPTSR
ncbi:hypothetical protein C4J81_14335 [Deltaproteobacteria bacterium Smac51]|nr:hypothetical protein C4J81_14335 [Deltaproteobacteria bacterium Smac51]